MAYNKGSAAERELKKLLEAAGYRVVRSGGSGADGTSPDLLALKTTKRLAIECKYWANSLYIDKEKFAIMCDWERATGVPVFVAWRQARKGWRFFPLAAFNETPAGHSLNKREAGSGISLDDIA
jgi:Holliday junction resolvase